VSSNAFLHPPMPVQTDVTSIASQLCVANMDSSKGVQLTPCAVGSLILRFACVRIRLILSKLCNLTSYETANLSVPGALLALLRTSLQRRGSSNYWFHGSHRALLSRLCSDTGLPAVVVRALNGGTDRTSPYYSTQSWWRDVFPLAIIMTFFTCFYQLFTFNTVPSQASNPASQCLRGHCPCLKKIFHTLIQSSSRW
jgi:hypothetical protein